MFHKLNTLKMEIYKIANRQQLRFSTTKGILSVEQLWNLSSTDLSNCVKAVKKILKKSDDDELSFLDDSQVVDKENQLRFDILKDIYLTKKKEAEELRDAASAKQHNQKILALIAEKQEEGLRGKSIDELQALLK